MHVLCVCGVVCVCVCVCAGQDGSGQTCPSASSHAHAPRARAQANLRLEAGVRELTAEAADAMSTAGTFRRGWRMTRVDERAPWLDVIEEF